MNKAQVGGRTLPPVPRMGTTRMMVIGDSGGDGGIPKAAFGFLLYPLLYPDN